MNDEQQFAEIEKTMFDLDGAIQYADESIAKLRRGGAAAHLIEAMEQCRDEVRATHKRLLQRTYWAHPDKAAATHEQPSLQYGPESDRPSSIALPMEIDVRIRWSHLDTDEEHFVVERVPLPRNAVQRERQLRELTFKYHPDASQRLYNHEKGHAAFNTSRWLIVTKYEWGTEAEVERTAPLNDEHETMPLFGA